MAIRYYLQPYVLASDKKVFKGRAVPEFVYDEAGIIEQIVQMGSTVSHADCQAVLTLFFETVANKVAQGCHVNTRLFKIKPVVSGIFDSPSDTFDNGRHTVKGSFSEGLMLTDVMAKATFEKTTKSPPMPLLVQFTDVTTGELNNRVTPQGIGVVNGDYLDFDTDSAEQGIYFSGETGQIVKVGILADVTKKKLVFQIPMLEAGSYTIEIRKDFSKSESLLRSGLLRHRLRVI